MQFRNIARLTQLQGDMQRWTNEITSRINELGNAIATLDRPVQSDSSGGEVSAIVEEQIEAINSTIATLRSSINSINNSISTMVEDIDSNKDDIKILKSSSNSSLESRLATLEEKDDIYINRFQKIEKALTSLDERITALEPPPPEEKPNP